jgi:hypothetical protein
VDAGGVEVIHQGGEVADAAAESVEAADEQQVVPSGSGVREGLGEAGPVEGGAGGVVGEVGGDLPAGLGVDVRGEPFGLASIV